MSESEMVWTGTGWARNPALPPLPEPEAQAPIPGFYGGSYVPHNVGTTIPNAAFGPKRQPQGMTIQSSPQVPTIHQHAIPYPVMPPQAAMRAAILAGAVLPSGFRQPGATEYQPAIPGMIPSPLGGGHMIPNPVVEPPPPSRLVYDEGALIAAALEDGGLEEAEEPEPRTTRQTATMLVVTPSAPIVPPAKLDPIAEQIAKAKAAATSGKL